MYVHAIFVCLHLPSGDGILNGVGECVPHVQATSDVGRREAEHKHTLWIGFGNTLTLRGK